MTILIGPGNNGGDGLVAGRVIAEESVVQVRFYLLKPRDDTDSNFKAVQDAGLFIAYAEEDRDFRVLRNMVASADVVVDALFGIGCNYPSDPMLPKSCVTFRRRLTINNNQNILKELR